MNQPTSAPNQLNTTTWLDPEIAASYEGETVLQGAEALILEELRPLMRDWSMLDVGVGAGRTTHHFAPAVAEYIGVDISPPMVEACRRHYGSEHRRFEVVDVLDLSRYGNQRFDFVMFSFNGLDYLTHEDRARALEQLHATCKPGAYFCFSTHNIQALPHVMPLRPQITRHPVRLWRNMSNWLRWWLGHSRHMNRVIAERRDWAIVNDGAHECRLSTYYVRPKAQLAQLDPMFSDIRAFTYRGRELARNDLDSVDDAWLYYLCRAR
jgi:SAM-dependent methyltransferase